MNQNIPWICLSAEDLVDLQPAVIEIHYQADISTAPLTGVAASVVGSDTSIRS